MRAKAEWWWRLTVAANEGAGYLVALASFLATNAQRFPIFDPPCASVADDAPGAIIYLEWRDGAHVAVSSVAWRAIFIDRRLQAKATAFLDAVEVCVRTRRSKVWDMQLCWEKSERVATRLRLGGRPRNFYVVDPDRLAFLLRTVGVAPPAALMELSHHGA
jgi:hypothetical protein